MKDNVNPYIRVTRVPPKAILKHSGESADWPQLQLQFEYRPDALVRVSYVLTMQA